MATKKTTKKITRPRPRITGSIADQIDSLEVDLSISTSERFPIADGPMGEWILDSLRKQRSALGAYVTRITDELDAREFKVESGTYLTDDKTALIATAAVTRVK